MRCAVVCNTRKAFDSADHNLLIYRSVQLQLPVQCFQRLLGSNFCVYHPRADQPLTFSTSKCVPQGSKIGHFLYLILVAYVSQRLRELSLGFYLGPQLIDHFFFADDLILLAPPNQMVELYNTVSQLLLDCKLELNRRKMKLLCNTQLVIADIELVEVSKYLGFPLNANRVCRRLMTNHAQKKIGNSHRQMLKLGLF